MMVNRMHADLIETIEKSREGFGAKRGGQHHDIGRAEIERFMGLSRPGAVVRLQEFVENLDHSAAQAFDGRKFPYVNAGKLLGKRGLIAGEQAPVSEVVRKSLTDEVMFLKRPECVLENRIIGTGLQRFEEFAKIVGLLPSDPEQVLGCVEVKGFLRLAQ